MRLVAIGVLIFLSVLAARAAITVPQITFGPKTEFRESKDWTLRISRSEQHENVIVLSVSGTISDAGRQRASLVYYCLDKDFFGVSFFVLPGGDRFKLLVDQSARYKLRDDVQEQMTVTPVQGLADQYESFLGHLEPSVGNANLVMIKHPAKAISMLNNARKGGDLRVSIKDRNNTEFHLNFGVDGLTELHDTVRSKCGW